MLLSLKKPRPFVLVFSWLHLLSTTGNNMGLFIDRVMIIPTTLEWSHWHFAVELWLVLQQWCVLDQLDHNCSSGKVTLWDKGDGQADMDWRREEKIRFTQSAKLDYSPKVGRRLLSWRVGGCRSCSDHNLAMTDGGDFQRRALPTVPTKIYMESCSWIIIR